MMTASSVILALVSASTTVEFFTCEFARVERYDSDDNLVFGNERYPLITFVRREAKIESSTDVEVLKMIDPHSIVTKGNLTGIIDVSGSVVIYSESRHKNDTRLLIKGSDKEPMGREAWVVGSDVSGSSLREKPLFVGSCNSAQGAVAEKLLRDAR